MNRFIVSAVLAVTLTAQIFAGCSSDPPADQPQTGEDGGVDTSIDLPDTNEGEKLPKPVLATISPTSALVGSIGPTLVLTGDAFTPTSEARVNGTKLSTTFFAVNELRASIPTSMLEKAGTLRIVVFTPEPGGGESAARTFDVQNPKPRAERLSPLSAAAGSADLPITVLGTGFADGAVVLLEGAKLTTLSSSSTSVTSIIPAASLVSPGSREVVVQNPPPNEAVPNGANSEKLAFIVENPGSVQVTAVSPSFAYVGDGPIDITVSGTGFVDKATVSFNGASIPVKSIAPTSIVATVPAASLVNSQSVSVVVTTPPPGGGVSTPKIFDIRNPVPVLSSIAPNKILFGSGDQQLKIKGSSFAKDASVKFGNLILTSSFVNSGELSATLPGVAVQTVGTFAVTVTNPPIVGGTSSSVNVDIGCDTSGVTQPFSGPSAAVTFALNWPATKYPRLSAYSCPSTPSTTIAMPQLGWVVQNTSAQPLIISAWGVCKAVGTTQEDVILAFYPYDHVPTTDAERKACSRIGESSPASPEAGGSKWCPGLTKANGVGLNLSTCQKAVVLAQPYDPASTSYPSPAAIRIQAESQ